MTNLHYTAISTESARDYQSGSNDANGQRPERHISDGQGNPCRHCLSDISAGEPLLIMAYRPIPIAQPYAEVGPIFLHAEACDRYDGSAGIPAIFLDRSQMLIRGYGEDDRIVYGSGHVIATSAIEQTAQRLFEQPEISYIHLRSASYNCFQCRIDRS